MFTSSVVFGEQKNPSPSPYRGEAPNPAGERERSPLMKLR